MTLSKAADSVSTVALIPVFALLPPEVRSLVDESFERVAYPFGAVIVREDDEADSFYVLTSGMARVVKRTDSGDEVALNVLHPGDSFGEMGLLERTNRVATVRASSPVEALRLERSVFGALTRAHPQIREGFEALAKQRALWNFFRVHSSFSKLPSEGLALLVAGLERVTPSAGAVVLRQGHPPGAMYIVEEGRLRAFEERDGEVRELGYLRKGDFFGERSFFRREPRAASVEAVSDCVLLRVSPELVRGLLVTYPEFRERLEQRIAQYDYRKLASVPADFDEEMLPAEVAAFEKVGSGQAEPDWRSAATVMTPSPADAERRPREVPRRIRRFPHVYQLDEADCGAACVAMVCRHFGRAVSISHIREVVHTSTDGTSLTGIARGAEELGLEARSIRASKSKLEELPLPAIVHWEGNHWVVLFGVENGRVRIADPGRGLRKLAREEFAEKWSGYAVLLGYTELLEEAPVARSNLGWLRPFLRPHHAAVLLALFLALVVAGLQLVLPILTQVVVDQVLPHHDLGLLYLVLLALLAVLLATTGATVLQRYLLSKVAVRFDTATLDFLTGQLLRLPMSYFLARRTGDIERRLTGVRQIREFFVQSGIQALTAVTQLGAALVLMFVYSWSLALVYLASVPLYAGLLRFASRRLRPMYDSLEESYGKYASQQIDAIRGIETVKAMAAEESLRQLMLRQFESLADRLFRTQFLVMSYQGGIQLLSFLSLAVFLFVGAIEVVHGTISIGEFVSFQALVALANGPIIVMLLLWDELQLSRILLDRLNDVLDQEPEQGHARDTLVPVETLQGRVEVRNLGFRYGGPDSPPIIEGISFAVEPGQTVAIVGRSGSGKTTLIKCLAGLLEPTEGAILYDGDELRSLDYRTLRRQIGFVLQDSYLFDETILGNIAFGAENRDYERAVWAARAANADEFVQRLPLGYETRVGESGLRLSGGQQQRVAIARALYHRPSVLLFDEATSSLDTESERAVKESMDELIADRTSFVIAHRLSTIRDADRILVLERGRLVEDGSHDELMARQGLYFYLASQQLEL